MVEHEDTAAIRRLREFLVAELVRLDDRFPQGPGTDGERHGIACALAALDGFTVGRHQPVGHDSK